MTQLNVALKAMKELDIYKPYILEFAKNGTKTLFDRAFGYFIGEDNEPALYAKIKAFEEETGSLVYAVTHEHTEFGECYSFLYVSKYEKEWGMEVMDGGGYSIVWAYVWNKTCEDDSEFGSIGVKSFGGGIVRVY